MVKIFFLVALFRTFSISAAEPPGSVLDLSSWRLTLPVDTERPGRPDEISQPKLKTFTDPRFFFVSMTGDGVVFRAHCDGKTTKGSSFPRCELREMTPDGQKQAEWSTEDETAHTMTMNVAITKTPTVKKHVVCAQIHDADDDLLMIRLEGEKLFIERNKVGDVMLDRKYKLGTPFDLKIEAKSGTVRVWHNAKEKLAWPVSRKGCYFKAGCYTQSNTKKGDSADAFGEVVIYDLTVE